jgi:valyl-tRNA synthetase
VIPFVTEEIYGHVPGAEGLLAGGVSIARATIDDAAESSVERVINAIQAMRAWRDFSEVKAGAIVPARLAAEGYEETREHLARLARLSFTPDGAHPVASVPVPGGVVEILPSGDVDTGAAERKRAAQGAKLEQDIERSERKLANRGFVENAPPDVVAGEREKLDRLRGEREAL